MTTKASARTTLVWGTVRAPVALFKATGDRPKLPSFEKAGPNGYPIEANPGPAAEIPPERAERLIEAEHERRDAFEDIVADVEAPAPVKPYREKHSGVELDTDEIRHGVYAGPEGETFVDCTDNLRSIEEKTKLDEMEIVGTIPAASIPRDRVRGAYFVGTDGDGSLSVLNYLYLGLRKSARIAIAKVTKSTRQSLVALVPRDYDRSPVIEALELAWADDLRDPPARAKLDPIAAMANPEATDLATDLVKALAIDLGTLDGLKDDAIELREDLRAAAMEGHLLPTWDRVATPEPESVEDALRQSAEIYAEAS